MYVCSKNKYTRTLRLPDQDLKQNQVQKSPFQRRAVTVQNDDEEPMDLTEDKAARVAKNWINSLDLRSRCNFIYSDLRDGIILLKILDRIQPAVVDWDKVVMPPYSKMIDASHNCCYFLEILECHGLGVRTNGTVRGHDIHTGQPKNLTLGIVIQLMRSYKLSLLYNAIGQGAGDGFLPASENTISAPKSPNTRARQTKSASIAFDKFSTNKADQEVLNWVNSVIEDPEEHISSFNDSKLRLGNAFAFCLQRIAHLKGSDEKPESFASVRSTDDIFYENAQHLIGTARKFGALIYTLPEHICNVDSGMMRCLFVTLRILEKQEIMNSRSNEEVDLKDVSVEQEIEQTVDEEQISPVRRSSIIDVFNYVKDKIL